MRLLVVSHKVCWPSARSTTGYATDGGFPLQMRAIADLFDETRLLLPVRKDGGAGEIAMQGHNLSVVPLAPRSGTGVSSKLSFLPWLLRNWSTFTREVREADAVHAPIPGDVGTVGMLLAWLTGKPLFVRHCGNWTQPMTIAEKFWHWFMVKVAGGRNIMLATGGRPDPPSAANPNVQWIFSSSLTAAELTAYGHARSYPSTSPRLILVARQEMAKGAGLVIESLPLLSQQLSGTTFEVVGDGPAIPELKRLAIQCGAADRVHFAGKLNHDQVMERLRHADLFMFPTSSSDGFPKAVLEGLASGLPVIATRVSVLPTLLGGGAGVLIDQPSPQAVARAIESSLADAATYEEMSRQAVETAGAYSLESWRDTIGSHLSRAWGPLKSGGADSIAIAGR